jgi:NADPH-dependent 2,4-dienoyl-CoA reductase/sulfur reductase-like enzyme
MPHVIERLTVRRHVVVIGAGPAGLEAARVAPSAATVTVLEAMPWAGGQIRFAARNPRRKDLLGIVEWRVAELERLGVEVHYDTYADAALVRRAVARRRDRRDRRAAAACPMLEAGDDLVVEAGTCSVAT